MLNDYENVTSPIFVLSPAARSLPKVRRGCLHLRRPQPPHFENNAIRNARVLLQQKLAVSGRIFQRNASKFLPLGPPLPRRPHLLHAGLHRCANRREFQRRRHRQPVRPHRTLHLHRLRHSHHPNSFLRHTFRHPLSTLTRTFTGQVFDAETGLMLYRNRVYSPTLGRFSVRDPIGYEGRDNNLYRYVKNSPFVFTDCLGLQFMNGLEGIAGTSNDVSVAIGRSMAEQGQLVKPAPPMAPAHNCTTAICEIQCEKYHHYNIDWRIVHTGVVLDRTMSRGECLKRCQISERLFNEWYTKNLDLSWTTRLPPCPCKLNDRCKEKWEEPTSQLHGFHSGAMKCMRSKPNSEGHANQCCYDTNENLILVGSGQGSCDYGIGEVSLRFLTHFSEDMIPANLADFLDGKKWGCFSEAYLNVRPQIHNCSS